MSNIKNNTEEGVSFVPQHDPGLQATPLRESLFLRSLWVSYALASYLIAILGVTYFILFISDLFIPVTVNSGPFDGSILSAFAVNLGLLLLFGLQHSVMARPKFKHWLTRYIDPSIERATYCLGTGLVIGFMCCAWQPMQGEVWSLDSTLATGGIRAIAVFGWVIMLIATFNIDHFELFGLRQVYTKFVGKPMPETVFKMVGLYKWVRHPIQTGLLIGMWAVPQASLSYLMLATGMTVYIFVGLYFEEQDLIAEFGQTYRDYKQKVAKVFPFI
ncbi:MAG: protein-S-isoprenylcysteine O-methyltransferase Ste14 [Paraglaciecola sp.]|jgi:protein-S-isoprenylcysteine O-methyltransferase Ste14